MNKFDINKPVVTLPDNVSCKGSIKLGSACMKCKKCLAEWEFLNKKVDYNYTTKEPLELRMYSLVMYNLSPIQQGIQACHSIVEMSLENSKEYKDWAENHKTIHKTFKRCY